MPDIDRENQAQPGQPSPRAGQEPVPGAPSQSEVGDAFLDMEAYMAALSGLAGGPSPAQAPAGASLPALAARLSRLEEHFARICTLVGRLEQEVLAIKEEAAGRGR
ncbi:hypothetical protein [Solidesulfovibrio sp.]|uniref:hypothetical protein n=1 Tax=Solidesulfovibrio sp. TaxID=2910990 RepID=UPI0026133052|nr:hypothetical protein [Solidesulfovibrio sp.]